jgi:hypothetical protein
MTASSIRSRLLATGKSKIVRLAPDGAAGMERPGT